MTTRLIMTMAIPLVGLLLLLGALAVVAGGDAKVTYADRTYTGGAIVPQPADLVPTDDRVREKQVWTLARAAAPPASVYLQRPDGRFERYDLVAAP